jgi:hypothetical protein
MACAFSDAAVALETADAEVDALVTQALAKAGGERPQGVHIDPEQTLAMHLIQELKPDCCCAVCQVLREYCEETFRDQDPPS